VKTIQQHRSSIKVPLVGFLAVVWFGSAVTVKAVPLEPDDMIGVTQSGPAINDQRDLAIEIPMTNRRVEISLYSLSDEGPAPRQARYVDIDRQGDHQLIADYHELLFQIGLATGSRSPQSSADLSAALEAAGGLVISPTGATVFTWPAYEEYRNIDPDVVEEDPATETYSIVSDADVSAGRTEVAVGELATAASAAGSSTDWTSSAISLDPISVARTGLSGASPGASSMAHSAQGNAAGSAAGPAAEPSTLALLFATVTAIVITVQAVRQSLKESD
jgi:hypothetical protein